MALLMDRAVGRLCRTDCVRRLGTGRLSSYSPDAIAAIVRPTLDRFRQLGFRRKEHLHVIAAWGVLYGPEFIGKDPDGVLGRICAAEMSEQDKFAALKKRMAEFSKPEVRT